MNLIVDPARVHPDAIRDTDYEPVLPTGILVKAKAQHLRTGEDMYINADIMWLTRDSLLAWLRSRGGSNPWAENVVLLLLDHEPEQTPPHDRGEMFDPVSTVPIK